MPESLSILIPFKAWLFVAAAAALAILPFLANAATRLATAAASIAGVGRRPSGGGVFRLLVHAAADLPARGSGVHRPLVFCRRRRSRHRSQLVARPRRHAVTAIATVGLAGTTGDGRAAPRTGDFATIDDPRYPAGYLTWLVITPGVYVVGVAALLLYSKLGGQSDEHPILKLTQTPAISPAAHVGMFLLLLAEASLPPPSARNCFSRNPAAVVGRASVGRRYVPLAGGDCRRRVASAHRSILVQSARAG